MPKSEEWLPDFPVIRGFGSTQEMRDAPDNTERSRLWDLRSTSKAACAAYDRKGATVKALRVGFVHRRPK